MSSDRPAIEAKGLGKRYRLGEAAHFGDLAHAFGELVRAPGRALRRRPARAELWALREVDLDVKRGEVLGLIGANGAGKTTLLRVLARITEPTEGRFTIRGRAASLLDVGTGFHLSLTGRENVYLSGTILGMRRREIDRCFDEIVAYAGLEEFLDTPLKRYSAGMYVRLGFAVAAHLEAEILLVDEVLAVGDEPFRQKSLGTMGEAARGGRTVVFVSHDLDAIQGLCSRVALLDGGRIRAQGDPGTMVRVYREAAAGAGPADGGV